MTIENQLKAVQDTAQRENLQKALEKSFEKSDKPIDSPDSFRISDIYNLPLNQLVEYSIVVNISTAQELLKQYGLGDSKNKIRRKLITDYKKIFGREKPKHNNAYIFTYNEIVQIFGISTDFKVDFQEFVLGFNLDTDHTGPRKKK